MRSFSCLLASALAIVAICGMRQQVACDTGSVQKRHTPARLDARAEAASADAIERRQQKFYPYIYSQEFSVQGAPQISMCYSVQPVSSWHCSPNGPETIYHTHEFTCNMDRNVFCNQCKADTANKKPINCD
ncbi:uncharacterized protein PSFLO_07158 [Pseudozyma flocculosa]|nr:uncharacterized protein PSFLO_07158 [Pseudozyma flocculosa]